jgi:hypothetical protein
MASYRRYAAQHHEHPAHFFWGRNFNLPPAPALVQVERPPAIKSAKAEKVPVKAKGFF